MAKKKPKKKLIKGKFIVPKKKVTKVKKEQFIVNQ